MTPQAHGRKIFISSISNKGKSVQLILHYCRIILHIFFGISNSIAKISFDRNNIGFQKFPNYMSRLCFSCNWESVVECHLGHSFSYQIIKVSFHKSVLQQTLPRAVHLAEDISKQGLRKRSSPFLTIEDFADLVS